MTDSRRQAAGETGAAQLADYRDLIGQIDAAIVAAPATLHHAIGMELLRHGIHVLMEKPLAVTTAEAEELVWAADWHGAVLQVGHIEQFNPALRAGAAARAKCRGSSRRRGPADIHSARRTLVSFSI